MNRSSPDIAQLAKRLLAEVHRSVPKFPVDFKRTLGVSLREDALQILLVSEEAYRQARRPAEQIALIDKVSTHIDRVKAQWQVAYDLQCFSFKRSAEVGRILHSIGKQCGGWKAAAEQRLKGQNPAGHGQQERAPILSTGTASSEASR